MFENVKTADESVCGYDAPIGTYEPSVKAADENVKGMDYGEAVVARFFEAMECVSEDTTMACVLRDCDIESHNFYKKRRGDRGNSKVPVAWLSSLCENYRISPEWLLLGRGKMRK